MRPRQDEPAQPSPPAAQPSPPLRLLPLGWPAQRNGREALAKVFRLTEAFRLDAPFEVPSGALSTGVAGRALLVDANSVPHYLEAVDASYLHDLAPHREALGLRVPSNVFHFDSLADLAAACEAATLTYWQDAVATLITEAKERADDAQYLRDVRAAEIAARATYSEARYKFTAAACH